jgi:Family of unknown function (DUF6163)
MLFRKSTPDHLRGRLFQDQAQTTDPMAGTEGIGERRVGEWTGRLVWFLRAMAALSLIQGLYHWSVVIGIVGPPFEGASTSWQAATMFFAVIDLVAAVGLWLAAAWGAVVWLTATLSMAAVQLLLPQVYGGSTPIALFEFALVLGYMGLAVLASRERR